MGRVDQLYYFFVVRLEMGLAWGFLFILIPPGPCLYLVSAPGTTREYICCGLQRPHVRGQVVSCS